MLPEHEMSEKLVGGETGKQGYIVETIPCQETCRSVLSGLQVQ